jgi:hypothetical protein
MKAGDLYAVNAPISGFCFAWEVGKASVNLNHNDRVVYLGKDLTQSAMRNQPICEVLSHKGKLFVDERWLTPLQEAPVETG